MSQSIISLKSNKKKHIFNNRLRMSKKNILQLIQTQQQQLSSGFISC